MPSALRDLAGLAAIGAVVGAMLGVLAAGAHATWQFGGDISQVGLATFFTHNPWAGGGSQDFQTGLLIIAMSTIASAFALAGAGYRPRRTSKGSAQWATKADLRVASLLTDLAGVRGPIYGKLGVPGAREVFVTSTDIPHSIIVAPTGSGKGVGVVIPTLLTYAGSVICLDLKGENFQLTARRRQAMGDRVIKFAPYDPHGRTHRYNPLTPVIEAHPRSRYTAARRVAAALITADGNGRNFLEGAREIFAATAMLVLERGTPTLGAMYDALAEQGEAYAVFRRHAQEVQSQTAQKVFRWAGGLDSRILSSYTSVLASGGLSLWGDPAVRAATEASDFSLANLRRDPASIYIVVQPNDLGAIAPLIRLMFQQSVATLQAHLPEPDEPFPVLFLLDEFASLGRMEVLKQAITTLRGYGGRIMMIVQTLASLREDTLYGREGAGVFLANSRIQLFMSPADNETAEYISSAIGDVTQVARTKTRTFGRGGATTSEREEAARLIRASDLRKLGETKVVILVQNANPVQAHRVTYYADRDLLPLFEAQDGRLPEPASLHPEDTNAFLADRLTRAKTSERRDPTTQTVPSQAGDQTSTAIQNSIEKEEPAVATPSQIVGDRRADETPEETANVHSLHVGIARQDALIETIRQSLTMSARPDGPADLPGEFAGQEIVRFSALATGKRSAAPL